MHTMVDTHMIYCSVRDLLINIIASDIYIHIYMYIQGVSPHYIQAFRGDRAQIN